MPRPKIHAQKPKNLLLRPVAADFKELFKALGKGVGHMATAKWDELAGDAVEALAALGLSSEPGEVAYSLVRKAATQAAFALISETANPHIVHARDVDDDLEDQLDLSVLAGEVVVDRKFFERPANLPFVKGFRTLLRDWIALLGVPEHVAHAVSARFPAYFVYALNEEWRANPKNYRSLLEAVDTPFTHASEREWAWRGYNALLQKRAEEGVFDEPFSLLQIYVPLRAYYVGDQRGSKLSEEIHEVGHRRRKIVVDLETELREWITRGARHDAIRVISGGPGSGKSSFAKVFAARLAAENRKVLFIPLHLIDPSKEVIDEVGRFVLGEGVLSQNPLGSDSPEPNLLIFFDGLDELASQGKAAAETARAFIREIERMVEMRNMNEVNLRVVISGRELIVQENEPEFRKPRQVLTLLPYFTRVEEGRGEDEYSDPNKLLALDLRSLWWSQYGDLTGRKFVGLPPELERGDLEDVTAQPLLNYLIALSYTRDHLDFSKNLNLNEVYQDLVVAVHERAYEKGRQYLAIRHMTQDDFIRVLEEVGLAAWHGDGRTTTVREIEEHCAVSGVSSLLGAFSEGARAGVTRLLAAFFFRQYGRRSTGDPTFVFTHKSFGEYLAARRLVRAMERVTRERDRRYKSADEGWDERDALKHWVQICGPSRMSHYLRDLLVNEVRLRRTEDIVKMQDCLTELFSYVLGEGMPMEMIPGQTFRIASFQSRNAEESILVALNACAVATQRVSQLQHPERTAFGTWFRRIQGQRMGGESYPALESLSYLNLGSTTLHMIDLYGADLSFSDLRGVHLAFACLVGATATNADFRGSSVHGTNFTSCNLTDVDFSDATVQNCNFAYAVLGGGKWNRTDLGGSDLSKARLGDADFSDTDTTVAQLPPARKKRPRSSP